MCTRKGTEGSNPSLSAISNGSLLVLKEGLDLAMRPAKVEYEAVFLSLKD